ncbi:MAG: FKBP-type peptidyl-prolyl cis-trans isomerase [Bacteroidales bacterium]|nr:FKBP-type peptidyl-prolyl cis-trans isomerase [Bacteroidales bacterium]
MKLSKILLTSLAVAALFNLTSCNKSNVKLDNAQDTVSWVMGESLALSVQSAPLKINKEVLIKAFEATMNGKDQPIDNQTYATVMQALNEQMMQFQQLYSDQVSQQEEQMMQQKMAENPNIKKAEEGFYYEIIKVGKGATTKKGDLINFDYKAMYMDGTLFDQTYGNREPITKALGDDMIPGLRMAFLLMNAGSTYRFYFPSKFVQGGIDIPAGTCLIYEIELHSINVPLKVNIDK